jgi:hypothetical protein
VHTHRHYVADRAHMSSVRLSSSILSVSLALLHSVCGS